MVQLRLTLVKIWMFVNGFTGAAKTILRDPRLTPDVNPTLPGNSELYRELVPIVSYKSDQRQPSPFLFVHQPWFEISQ